MGGPDGPNNGARCKAVLSLGPRAGERRGARSVAAAAVVCMYVCLQSSMFFVGRCQGVQEPPAERTETSESYAKLRGAVTLVAKVVPARLHAKCVGIQGCSLPRRRRRRPQIPHTGHCSRNPNRSFSALAAARGARLNYNWRARSDFHRQRAPSHAWPLPAAARRRWPPEAWRRGWR